MITYKVFKEQSHGLYFGSPGLDEHFFGRLIETASGWLLNEDEVYLKHPYEKVEVLEILAIKDTTIITFKLNAGKVEISVLKTANIDQIILNSSLEDNCKGDLLIKFKGGQEIYLNSEQDAKSGRRRDCREDLIVFAQRLNQL